MTSRMDINGENALKFFGKMTASIAHETKNVLAIINENAGLLEDLCAMSERGKPVDPGRIKTIAGKVIKQVQRGDEIIKKLNSFAHSADELDCNVDVNDILMLVTGLAGRIALVRGINLETDQMTDPVIINTNPFLLETLVWLFLDYAMEAAGEGKTVSVTAEKQHENAVIRFSGLKGLAGMQPDSFPGDSEKALLAALNATAATDAVAGEIIISFAS
ncbi:MAG: sensor histidine kinase [Pseudomonadota bacterium]